MGSAGVEAAEVAATESDDSAGDGTADAALRPERGPAPVREAEAAAAPTVEAGGALSPSPRRIEFLGLPVDVVRAEDVLRTIGELCATNGRVHTLVYLNAHGCSEAAGDPRYRELIEQADLVYPDGMSIVWGSRLLGTPLPEKLTLSDLVEPIAAYAAERDMRIYLLGGRDGVAARAGQALARRIPDLQIAGTHHGFFGPDENDKIVDAINRAKPHILFVGMGVPYQEKWVGENLDRLEVPVCIPCGGLFNYVAGEIPRAPHWMSEHGLEWFFRLCVEPRRLWRRYSVENARFAWRLGRSFFSRSGPHRSGGR